MVDLIFICKWIICGDMSEPMLDELHGSTIAQHYTPTDIAMIAAKAAGLPEMLENDVKQILASGAQDHENESHLVRHTEFVSSANTFFSELATVIEHEPDSEAFRHIAHNVIQGRAAESEFSDRMAACLTAAELGRGLARHISESSLAIDIDGIVAPASDESAKIDVRKDDTTIQVQTCFANSSSTTGRTAEEKLNGEIPEGLDYYVVLHYDLNTDENKFGVGVNDLSSGFEIDSKNKENTVAKNALK